MADALGRLPSITLERIEGEGVYVMVRGLSRALPMWRLNSILGGRSNTEEGATIGHRFGKTHKLGVLFGGSFDYNGRGIDNWQPAIDPTSTFANPIYDNNTIREYRYYRNRGGFAGTADYKLSDSSALFPV